MENYMWIIWLAIFVITIIIEAISTDLVTIWFSLGSILALIISFIPGVDWWIELIIFTVVSIVSLLCLRPLASKMLKRNTINSNVDEMIHKKGKMIKGCDEINHGEVKINGVIWTAISSDEKVAIKEGALVEVLALDGNKLVVKEVE